MITLTYIILALGLTIGLFAGDQKPLFVTILLVTTYWLGLMGGQNTEFERAILFAVFQLLAGAYTAPMKEYLGAIALYSLIGYISVIATLTLLVFVRRHTPNPYNRVRTTIKDSLTLDPGRHAYALCYSLAVLASLMVIEYFDFSHGYWAIGTVLIIMRPSFTQSIYRLVQRLLGTVLGVLVAEALIYSVHSTALAIVIVAVVSFWGPWALARSYWLGSTVVSIILLILLDMPHLEYGDLQTPIMRLLATGLGCALSLAGAVLANPRALFSRKD